MQAANQGRPFQIDDRVLDRVLSINPGLRRETLRVVPPETGEAPERTRPSVDAVFAAVTTFVTMKRDDLARQFARIDAQRQALAADENRLRDAALADLVNILGVVERTALQRHGVQALAPFGEFLMQLNTTAQSLLARVQK